MPPLLLQLLLLLVWLPVLQLLWLLLLLRLAIDAFINVHVAHAKWGVLACCHLLVIENHPATLLNSSKIRGTGNTSSDHSEPQNEPTRSTWWKPPSAVTGSMVTVKQFRAQKRHPQWENDDYQECTPTPPALAVLLAPHAGCLQYERTSWVSVLTHRVHEQHCSRLPGRGLHSYRGVCTIQMSDHRLLLTSPPPSSKHRSEGRHIPPYASSSCQSDVGCLVAVMSTTSTI